MLFLISIGLRDEKDMSLRAIETALSCDSLYLELYTSPLATDALKISKMIGRPVIALERADLEERSGKLIEEARERNVGIFVGGDCLTATTHASLLLDAKTAGVPTKVVHGSSIYSAVTETGLFIYKFGRTASIPYTEQTKAVEQAIKENKKAGLHTLLLLDIDPVIGAMPVALAVKILLKNKILKESDKIIAACALGSDDAKIVFDKVKMLSARKLPVPAVLVVPGKLHFHEKEFLESLIENGLK